MRSPARTWAHAVVDRRPGRSAHLHRAGEARKQYTRRTRPIGGFPIPARPVIRPQKGYEYVRSAGRRRRAQGRREARPPVGGLHDPGGHRDPTPWARSSGIRVPFPRGLGGSSRPCTADLPDRGSPTGAAPRGSGRRPRPTTGAPSVQAPRRAHAFTPQGGAPGRRSRSAGLHLDPPGGGLQVDASSASSQCPSRRASVRPNARCGRLLMLGADVGEDHPHVPQRRLEKLDPDHQPRRRGHRHGWPRTIVKVTSRAFRREQVTGLVAGRRSPPARQNVANSFI